MDPRRSERLSEALREELDEMIAYELSDPRIEAAGVAEVAVSPDARHARVRVLLPGDKASQAASLEALNHAKSYIRRELAVRIDLFRIPEIHFEAAIEAGLGGRLEHLMKRVRKGRPRESAPEVPQQGQSQVADDKATSQKKSVS